MSDIEEDVVLARIGNERSEMLSDYAVPVGRVLLVEEALEILRNLFLCLLAVNSSVNLLLNIVFHVLVHLTDDPCHASLRHLSRA